MYSKQWLNHADCLKWIDFGLTFGCQQNLDTTSLMDIWSYLNLLSTIKLHWAKKIVSRFPQWKKHTSQLRLVNVMFSSGLITNTYIIKWFFTIFSETQQWTLIQFFSKPTHTDWHQISQICVICLLITATVHLSSTKASTPLWKQFGSQSLLNIIRIQKNRQNARKWTLRKFSINKYLWITWIIFSWFSESSRVIV